MRIAGWLLLLSAISVPVLVARADDLPPDWQAQLIESFDREPYALAGPPSEILRRDFTRFSLTRFRDARISGSSARWQVQPAAGITETSLVLPQTAAADGFAVWIKNPLEHAVELSLRLTDTGGRTWSTKPKSLLTQKGWFRHVFDLQELFVGEQAPELPYRVAELVLSGLAAGTEYTLYLDELCALQAPPPQLRVAGLTAPDRVRAGGGVSVQLALQSPAGSGRPAALTLRLVRGTTPVLIKAISIAPRQARAEIAVTVPRHIAAGPYQWKLTALDADLTGTLSRDVTVEAGPPPAEITVRRAAEGGCFSVGGTALPLIGGWWRGAAPPERADWVMLHLTSDFDFTGQCSPVWLGPDKYDYSQVDERLAAALTANPEAYVIPIVTLSSPPWWDQQHAKELMVFGDGLTQLPVAVPGAKRTFAAWSSAVWRHDAGAALTRLVQHLETGPWGPAIIGYQLASGEGGRWVYPGASDGVFADYSQPQQEAFRAWLKNKYQDLMMLRVAWGQPREPVMAAEALKELQPIMGWQQARVPGQARRTRAPTGVLHDPTAIQDVVDYQIFCSDVVVETIRHFGGLVKQATDSRKLVGAAYGHLFDLAATRYGLQNGGHLAIAPICNADELDFIVSPGSFGESGNPPLTTMVAASLANHGKLWLAQGDAGHTAATAAHALASGGVAAVEGPIEARIPPRLRSLRPAIPRGSASEIAVIVDDISAAYTACGSDLVKPLLSDQRLGLALIGAPYDVWTLDDVLAGQVAGYKLYVFLDAFYLDANARQQLLSALSQQPCTALWIYAPGALDIGMSSRMMKDLTGLTLVRPLRRLPEGGITDRGPLQVRVGGSGGYAYGTPLILTPRFAALGDNADIRGHLVDSELGGFAVTERDGVKSVWSAAPHLPASLLRSIALDAEVHLYAESGTGVYANQNLMAIRASADGEQHIRLPRLAEVYDLDTGRPVGASATEFVSRLKAGEIKFYYWGATPLVEK